MVNLHEGGEEQLLCLKGRLHHYYRFGPLAPQNSPNLPMAIPAKAVNVFSVGRLDTSWTSVFRWLRWAGM
jgi:hypothetical protein